MPRRGPTTSRPLTAGRRSSTAGWPSCSPSSAWSGHPAETQHEFARRAARFLAGRGLEHRGGRRRPPLVVDAFYRVRFGHLDLDPETLARLEARLDALEASLQRRREA